VKKFKRMPHRADSPDPAPGGFFVLRYLKNKLTEYEGSEWNGLKYATTAIVNGIGQEIHTNVFEA
jgi:hypothetical protein